MMGDMRRYSVNLRRYEQRSSSPAKAGDPITTDVSNRTATAMFTGCPAFAGHEESSGLRIAFTSLCAGAEAGGGLLHLGCEIRHLLHLPDLDHFVVGRRAARRPRDRLRLRFHLNHPVAAKHFVHARKR